MTICSVFIATSLDGFISRPDGSIDWLDQANQRVQEGEDFGYGAFFSTVDGLLIGRKTFEQVLSFDLWPYGDKPVFVLSHHQKHLPANAPATVRLTAEAPAALLQRLSALELNHLYVDGGSTIQSFLAAGLIDELILTTIPVLIGTGRPLFGPLPADVQLQRVSGKAFDCGFVQNTYHVLSPLARH